MTTRVRVNQNGHTGNFMLLDAAIVNFPSQSLGEVYDYNGELYYLTALTNNRVNDSARYVTCILESVEDRRMVTVEYHLTKVRAAHGFKWADNTGQVVQ